MDLFLIVVGFSLIGIGVLVVFVCYVDLLFGCVIGCLCKC